MNLEQMDNACRNSSNSSAPSPFSSNVLKTWCAKFFASPCGNSWTNIRVNSDLTNFPVGQSFWNPWYHFLTSSCVNPDSRLFYIWIYFHLNEQNAICLYEILSSNIFSVFNLVCWIPILLKIYLRKWNLINQSVY